MRTQAGESGDGEFLSIQLPGAESLRPRGIRVETRAACALVPHSPLRQPPGPARVPPAADAEQTPRLP